MALKYWNGSSWVDISDVKYWNGSNWLSAKAVYYWNGSSWVQAWPVVIVWAVNFDASNTYLYELNYSDFSTKRSKTVSGGSSYGGGGGDEQYLWVSVEKSGYIYRRAASDFSVINSYHLGVGYMDDCGGHRDSHVGVARYSSTYRYLYKFTPTLSSYSTITRSEKPTGIGGGKSRWWYASAETDKVYEIDPNNWAANIRSKGFVNPETVGGGDNHVYVVYDVAAPKLAELNPNDLSVIRSISRSYKGVGGE